MRNLAAFLSSVVIVGAATGGSAAVKPLDPASLAGVYKQRFTNGLVTGETFTSEDILEIVPVSNTSAYVRVHLEFYNGHTCSLSGIAHVERQALVYRTDLDYEQPPLNRCVLSIERSGDQIMLSDGRNSCKGFCGVRGSLMNVDFPAASRRPIRYMARLKASPGYRDAVALDANRR